MDQETDNCPTNLWSFSRPLCAFGVRDYMDEQGSASSLAKDLFPQTGRATHPNFAASFPCRELSLEPEYAGN